MKLNYSEPKIYTGGVDISQWSKLSKSDQREALSKEWYIYYSFRHPKTGRLKRQPNIKGGANKFKDKASRYHILKTLGQSLLYVLEEGFNPYNTTLGDYLNNRLKKKPNANKKIVKLEQDEKADAQTIEQAFVLGLETKKKVLNQNSFPQFKSRITRFKVWLIDNKIYYKKPIRFCRI